jgi:XTP/dITP diphosphohydrolase
LSEEEDTLKGANHVIQFATKNKGKFDEAARVAFNYGIELKQVNLEKYEIQADDLKKIAAIAAEQALREVSVTAILAEDAGFFIDALNGFPGPYSSYAYRTLGVKGILKLLENVDERRAHFACAVAYCEGDHTICFEGAVKGSVDLEPRGQQGFGFDPIFIPDQGNGRTFAEMDIDEKNRFSHRALAFSEFCKWAKSQSLQND